jgi:hypothetical protein
MDGIQKLLIVVITSLTILLMVVGIQVIMIISDLRRAVKRLNSLLEDSIIGGGLIRPDKLTGVLEFFKKKHKSKTVEHGDVK